MKYNCLQVSGHIASKHFYTRSCFCCLAKPVLLVLFPRAEKQNVPVKQTSPFLFVQIKGAAGKPFSNSGYQQVGHDGPSSNYSLF